MDEQARKGIKQVGAKVATSGLVLALLAILVLRQIGFTRISIAQWLFALAATLTIQGCMCLVAARSWDRHFRFDRRFVYVPMIAATSQLILYAYLAPELRMLLLMVWLVALQFLAGLVPFLGVTLLSLLMGSGYLVASQHLIRSGRIEGTIEFETVVTLTFLVISAFAGVVYQRLFRQRREMSLLRRQLTELAVTDPLTGLPNRRYLEDMLQSELQRIRRYGGVCSICLIDVDHFKNYNDTLGHQAGDGALIELASVFRTNLRLSDVLARYGGEEFVLIMVNTPRSEAVVAMDRLREIVAEHPFYREDVQPARQLTISAGIASCPADGDAYEPLVAIADQALYRAKRLGRNRVEAHDEPVGRPKAEPPYREAAQGENVPD